MMLSIILLLLGNVAFAASISTCFTPGQNCTAQIVCEIENAHKNLYIQAYSLTSKPIINAIIDDKKRGIDIHVLLDKTQRNGLGASLMIDNGIPVKIDDKVKIAHNKVIIIDCIEVITGSFNFTESAQKRNAENVVFIISDEIAKEYRDNWFSRDIVSTNLMRRKNES